ncbi:MAG: hypothetical protein D6732_13180 [Methanobacteriota archaeon]|nr:MAG: hypothetical protein D6732_13180 [Euryarchaeota archaeon]
MISVVQVLKALQHDVRLDILRMLAENPEGLPYSHFLPFTEGSTGKLNYHLRIMNGLLVKEGALYKLSEQGKKALQWITSLTEEHTLNASEPAVVFAPFFPADGLRKKYLLFFFLFLGLITPSGFFQPWIPIASILTAVAGVPFINAYFRSISYTLTETEIIIHKGILTKSLKIIPFRTITNIELKHGFFDRIFRISTVEVMTAGTPAGKSSDEKLTGLPDGKEIKETIIERIALLNPPQFFSTDTPFQAILEGIREVNEVLRE